MPSVARRRPGAETLRAQAIEAYGKRDFLRSEELALAAAKLDRDGRAELLYNAGCSFAHAGRVDDAFATLEKAGEAGMDRIEPLMKREELAV